MYICVCNAIIESRNGQYLLNQFDTIPSALNLVLKYFRYQVHSVHTAYMRASSEDILPYWNSTEARFVVPYYMKTVNPCRIRMTGSLLFVI